MSGLRYLILAFVLIALAVTFGALADAAETCISSMVVAVDSPPTTTPVECF